MPWYETVGLLRWTLHAVGACLLLGAGGCSDATCPPGTRMVDRACEACDSVFYADADGDGVGVADETIVACEVPEGYSPESGDCDDSSADVSPGAAEACNGGDDDCDGSSDEGLATSAFYEDGDGDGFGVAEIQACGVRPGVAMEAGDCDDESADTHPSADEVCDGFDNDCDRVTDEGLLQVGERHVVYTGDVDGAWLASHGGGYYALWWTVAGALRGQRIDTRGAPVGAPDRIPSSRPAQYVGDVAVLGSTVVASYSVIDEEAYMLVAIPLGDPPAAVEVPRVVNAVRPQLVRAGPRLFVVSEDFAYTVEEVFVDAPARLGEAAAFGSAERLVCHDSTHPGRIFCTWVGFSDGDVNRTAYLATIDLSVDPVGFSADAVRLGGSPGIDIVFADVMHGLGDEDAAVVTAGGDSAAVEAIRRGLYVGETTIEARGDYTLPDEAFHLFLGWYGGNRQSLIPAAVAEDVPGVIIPAGMFAEDAPVADGQVLALSDEDVYGSLPPNNDLLYALSFAELTPNRGAWLAAVDTGDGVEIAVVPVECQ